MPLHVELNTPEKLALKEDVDFVAAPTTEGEIGILPRHAPLLAKLELGPLRFRTGDKMHVLIVTGGFIEVQEGNRVSIFAETAEFAQDIDVERARLAVERAKNRLKEPSSNLTGEELAQVEASLSRGLMRIKIAENRWRKQPPQMPGHN
jgi:F-type H+-transporting ATPase subunit epsilon